MPTRTENNQINTSGKMSSQDDQATYLKRLIVTLKQQYEKEIAELNTKLQTEAQQKQALQKEFEKMQAKQNLVQQHHEEELISLQQQQNTLRDLLKKAQEDLKKATEQAAPSAASGSSHPELIASQQRIEQLERVIPYLRERTEEANLETEQIRGELEAALKKNKLLQAEIQNQQQTHQRKSDDLQQSLLFYEKNQDDAALSAKAYQLHHELIQAKQDWMQEVKTLEARYLDLLNEKSAYEQQVKHLQQQFERQSANFNTLNDQLREAEWQKKELELALQAKEKMLADQAEERVSLDIKLAKVNEMIKNHELLQEKYEQLREESSQSSYQLEEALEIRIRAEEELAHVDHLLKEQENHLSTQREEIAELNQEKEQLQQEIYQLRSLLDESEMRLKMAQQHLAKKVKEAAILNEKVEEQQSSLIEHQQMLETTKTQMNHLQTNMELYQKQEKRLQEQLHESLKSTENQVSKWEEKYFRMYDKWQESEERNRELKKFEEKHLQMQSLLANLGNFMGSSFVSPTALFQQAQVDLQEPHPNRPSVESDVDQENLLNSVENEESTEKMDLFGMRPPNRIKTNILP